MYLCVSTQLPNTYGVKFPQKQRQVAKLGVFKTLPVKIEMVISSKLTDVIRVKVFNQYTTLQKSKSGWS